MSYLLFRRTLPYGDIYPTIKIKAEIVPVIGDADRQGKLPDKGDVINVRAETEDDIRRLMNDWPTIRERHIEYAEDHGHTPNLSLPAWSIFYSIRDYMRYVYLLGMEFPIPDRLVIFQRLQQNIKEYTDFVITAMEFDPLRINISEQEFETKKTAYEILYNNESLANPGYLEQKTAQDIYDEQIEQNKNAFRLWCHCISARREVRLLCDGYKYGLQLVNGLEINNSEKDILSFVCTDDKNAVVDLLGKLLANAKGKKAALVISCAIKAGVLYVVNGEYSKLYHAIRTRFRVNIGTNASINKYMNKDFLFTKNEINAIKDKFNELSLVAETEDN